MKSGMNGFNLWSSSMDWGVYLELYIDYHSCLFCSITVNKYFFETSQNGVEKFTNFFSTDQKKTKYSAENLPNLTLQIT